MDTRFTNKQFLALDNVAGALNGGAGASKKGFEKQRNQVARLVMIEPTVITISQTACSSQDVDFTNADALAAYRRQESSQGAEVRDSAGVSQGLGGMAV